MMMRHVRIADDDITVGGASNGDGPRGIGRILHAIDDDYQGWRHGSSILLDLLSYAYP